MFIAALFTIAKPWKPPKCPLTDDWIKKMWYFIHNGILLNHKKKNKITPFAVIWLLGKLLYIEQINKVLLYSTENCIQFL